MSHTKPKTSTGSGQTKASSTSVLSAEDRRETPRIRMPKVEAEVVWLGLRVTVLEVGFGGLSILSEREFEPGEQHELRCRTKTLPPVILHLKVRHCRPDDEPGEPPRFVTGFQFCDTWVPGDHSAVDALIAQITIALSADSDE